MELFRQLRESIKNWEERDFYIYLSIALLSVCLLLGLLIYIHVSKVSKYTQEISEINNQRITSKNILAQKKLVSLQKATIEQMLAQDPNFLIGKKYAEIISRLGLSPYQPEEPTPQIGQTVSDKREITLNSHLKGINMQKLTELLSAIADVAQLYPKKLIIKKSPVGQSIDVDLSIATLETA